MDDTETGLVLVRELSKIATGYAARSVELKIAAHGRTPEIADMNLEHLVRQFLAPFEREGTLDRELHLLGLPALRSMKDVTIMFVYPDPRETPQ